MIKCKHVAARVLLPPPALVGGAKYKPPDRMKRSQLTARPWQVARADARSTSNQNAWKDRCLLQISATAHHRPCRQGMRFRDRICSVFVSRTVGPVTAREDAPLVYLRVHPEYRDSSVSREPLIFLQFLIETTPGRSIPFISQRWRGDSLVLSPPFSTS